MYRNNDPLQPDTLNEILALRPEGADAEPKKVDNLKKRMEGAVIGRLAGCILGVPVELYPHWQMHALALECGMTWPPQTYWKNTDQPDAVRYGVNTKVDYLEQNMKEAPVDDDITYMLLNLLLLEKYGKDYTLQNVADHWLEFVPYACTAEEEALEQLKAGTRVESVANFNPYVEWIGAAIRADAFGYACAGDPKAAAIASYNDAYLTHRKNGIYGEMFCAAAIAAAFTAETPLDAVREGLKQVPKDSEVYKTVDWALRCTKYCSNNVRALRMLEKKFEGMNWVHTLNNMAAIVFALALGKDDFTKCIGECVALGLDNDCTTATLGSIFGACYGIDAIPPYWYDKFNDTVGSYINGYPKFAISDVVDRFVKLNG